MGVALKDLVSDYRTPAGWDSLAGVAAIDANNTLYQFLSIIRQPDGTPLMDEKGRVTSHLSGILFRSVNLLQKGIRPVFIFDGKPHPLKGGTIEERRAVRQEAGEKWQEALERGDLEEAYKQARSSSRVDAHVIESSRKLLDLMGIPWMEAPGEGEAQAAFMALRGDAAYALSQDFDTLLFGAPVLIRNAAISGKRKIRGRSVMIMPERIVLSELLAGLSITREQLIEIGILTGTDFNEGVPGIGPKKGLKVVLAGEFDKVITEKQPEFDPVPVKEIFLRPAVTTGYTLGWGQPDREGIVAMLCGEYDFSEERVTTSLDGLKETSGQKTLDKWFG
ncbi:MAG: flap endonuclease-1 [Methanoregulaceae archaeon]